MKKKRVLDVSYTEITDAVSLMVSKYDNIP